MQPDGSQAMPCAQSRIADIAAVCIGGKPFLHRESIAAGTMECEPAVGAAHREDPSVGGNKYVRLRRARRNDDRERDEHQRRSSAAAS